MYTFLAGCEVLDLLPEGVSLSCRLLALVDVTGSGLGCCLRLALRRFEAWLKTVSDGLRRFKTVWFRTV